MPTQLCFSGDLFSKSEFLSFYPLPRHWERARSSWLRRLKISCLPMVGLETYARFVTWWSMRWSFAKGAKLRFISCRGRSNHRILCVSRQIRVSGPAPPCWNGVSIYITRCTQQWRQPVEGCPDSRNIQKYTQGQTPQTEECAFRCFRDIIHHYPLIGFHRKVPEYTEVFFLWYLIRNWSAIVTLWKFICYSRKPQSFLVLLSISDQLSFTSKA